MRYIAMLFPGISPCSTGCADLRDEMNDHELQWFASKTNCQTVVDRTLENFAKMRHEIDEHVGRLKKTLLFLNDVSQDRAAAAVLFRCLKRSVENAKLSAQAAAARESI